MCKLKKNIFFFFFFLGGGSGWGGGGRGGCEPRSEAFVKIQKKILGGVGSGGGSGWEVRVDVNGEVKLL